jgi:hypothetical protein
MNLALTHASRSAASSAAGFTAFEPTPAMGGSLAAPKTIRGPAVNSYSDFAGVLGTGVYVTGVAGTSILGVGVYGQLGEDDPLSPIPNNNFLLAGVAGTSSYSYAPGVMGWSKGAGVWGEGTEFAGVVGYSRNDVGVDATPTRLGPLPCWPFRKRAPASSAMRPLLGH